MRTQNSHTARLLVALLALVILLGLAPALITTANAASDSGNDTAAYYGRNALSSLPNSAALLYAYDQLAAGVEVSSPSITVYNGTDPISYDEIQVVLDAYRRDYTHHFWLSNNATVYSNSYTVTQVKPYYTLSGSQLTAAKAAFDAAAEEILSGIGPGMTEFQKELYLHDCLAARVTYVSADNAHNAYGALVEGRAVCEGYAEALQYLLQQAGIQSFLAYGNSRGQAHAWNYVRIDGRYYHVDLTWNDQDTTVYHAYFNQTDAVIQEDHTIESAAYPLPVCNSDDAQYFTVKGGKLSTYSVSSVAELLKANGMSACVYIPGDVNAFISWYWDNAGNIASANNIQCGYSYGYSKMGRELVIYIDTRCSHSNLTYVPPVAAGCTANGRAAYYTCSCGKWFADPTAQTIIYDRDSVVVYAKGHIYSGDTDATCNTCGQSRNVSGWVCENGKWAFYTNGKKAINQWMRDSAGWCFLGSDGYAVTNCWKKDRIGWCYLGSTGRMAVNAWVRDSVGWCFVGSDGYAVTNCWKKDSVGWCYLDSAGRMTVNAWVRDSAGWCFLGSDGYAVTNCWKKDSVGWCYLGSTGRMAVNAWVRDSVGWCFVGSDGYAVTNCWKKDSTGWCYLNAQGSMTKSNWVFYNGNWYYCNANGYMVTGTQCIGGTTYRFTSAGVLIP